MLKEDGCEVVVGEKIALRELDEDIDTAVDFDVLDLKCEI